MSLHRRALLQAVAAGALIAGTGRMFVLAQSKPRIIPVTAKKFEFDPAVLTLRLNEPVVFQLKSLDVVMGFSVPDFGVRGTIIPGQVTEVPMTPTKIGEFTFLCDVFCGSGHENMDGTMRVVA
jgi:cytochrome c oxidase subunit 2